FLLIALLLPLPLERRCKIPLLVIALCIAASRPMLGVHWPSDVIAGCLLGTAAALIGVAAATYLENQSPKEAA
ncbi:MAG: superfamily, partial [Pseudomonadota bacterium]